MWYIVLAPFFILPALAYGQLSLRSSGILVTDSQDGAAIVTLGLSTDRQSYYALLNTGQVNFRAALDTASSDLWITSSDCESPSCENLPRYPLSYQSPTFSSVNGNNTAFSVRYADTTTASGFVAQESVSVGNLTVTSQAFGLVTDTNVSFVDQVSGILGLGFPRLSTISDSITNSTPFFVTLAQRGLLKYPLFGLYLTYNSSGSLTIGAIDGSVVTTFSRIEWNDVVEFPPSGAESNVSSYLHWAIPLTAISVNDTQIKPAPTYPNIRHGASLALFDVGTPGIYGPYQDVSRLFDLIESSRLVNTDGQWAVPCDSEFIMSFTFGAQNFSLQPTDYLIGPTEGNPDLCLSWPMATPPSPDGIDWQLGSVFLRTVYSIFSYGINTKEPPMIGLFPMANSTSVEPLSSVSAFFSSMSMTVPTTLPNFLIATPTYTTPSYGFNSSISAPTGGIVKTALATSSYIPILGQHTNLSAMPTITPSPTLVTFFITDASGVVQTSVSTVTQTVTLGIPPGWSSASISRVPASLFLVVGLIIAVFII